MSLLDTRPQSLAEAMEDALLDDLVNPIETGNEQSVTEATAPESLAATVESNPLPLGNFETDDSVPSSAVDWGETKGLFLNSLPARKVWIADSTNTELERLSRRPGSRCGLCQNKYRGVYRRTIHEKSHFLRYLCPCGHSAFSADSHGKHQRTNNDEFSTLCKLRITYTVDEASFPLLKSALADALPPLLERFTFKTYVAREEPEAPTTSRRNQPARDTERADSSTSRVRTIRARTPTPPVTTSRTQERRSRFQPYTRPTPTATVTTPSLPALRPMSRRERRTYQELQAISASLLSLAGWVQADNRPRAHTASHLIVLRSRIESTIGRMLIDEELPPLTSATGDLPASDQPVTDGDQ